MQKEQMAPYFQEIEGRQIQAVWLNQDGIEFAYEVDGRPRSLTLRGEIHWAGHKEPGGTRFAVNSIPLSGPKSPVADFAPKQVEKIVLFEWEQLSPGWHSCRQLLRIASRRPDDAELKYWLVDWIWGDEPEGIQVTDDLGELEGFHPIDFSTYAAVSEKSELFCSESFKKALDFAAKAHGEQRTPKGLPYLVHLNAVAMEVIQSLHTEPLNFDENTLAVVCALLHDTLEDTSASGYSLKPFGPEVVCGVEALTKNKSDKKMEAMRDSLSRLRQQPFSVQRVKLADRICNLDRPPIYWDAKKCRRYQEEARSILRELQEASSYLSRRLAEKIAAYDRYIDEFAGHRYLVLFRTLVDPKERRSFLEQSILPLSKQDADYFSKIKATLTLSHLLASKREFILFPSFLKGNAEVEYGVSSEERLAKLLENGYQEMTLQQLYDNCLAGLDSEDEWLQRQIGEWAEVCGVTIG